MWAISTSSDFWGVRACVRAHLCWVFFLFSPRCSVPWEKKRKVLFFDGRCGLLPPPSREQAVAPMQRAPLPVCRQATMSETSPLTPFFIPQRCFQPLPLFKPPPSRTCTPLTSSCGEGGESVPARSDSRVRRPAEAVFPARSCFIVIYFEKPCSSQLGVSACVYVAYVFVCACLTPIF